MQLLPEAIHEFKELYLKEYGEQLSDEEATEQATALLNLFDRLTQSKEAPNNEN